LGRPPRSAPVRFFGGLDVLAVSASRRLLVCEAAGDRRGGGGRGGGVGERPPCCGDDDGATVGLGAGGLGGDLPARRLRGGGVGGGGGTGRELSPPADAELAVVVAGTSKTHEIYAIYLRLPK